MLAQLSVDEKHIQCHRYRFLRNIHRRDAQPVAAFVPANRKQG